MVNGMVGYSTGSYFSLSFPSRACSPLHLSPNKGSLNCHYIFQHFCCEESEK